MFAGAALLANAISFAWGIRYSSIGGYLGLCAWALPRHIAASNTAYISLVFIMVNKSPLSSLFSLANTNVGDLRIRRNQTLIPILSESLRWEPWLAAGCLEERDEHPQIRQWQTGNYRGHSPRGLAAPDIENLRHQVEQTLGMIDILVANAGGSFTMPGPLEEMSEQGWHASVDGNLTATFLIIKSILPGMKERKLGTIATISTAAGRRPHPQAPILYSAAKAGIQILTQVVAIRNSPEVPAANFVLDTSPGKHQVVWKVSGFGQDEAEALLHSLANRFDGDLAATDSTRVLRLPGFANHKLAEEFVVQARQESNAVYALRDFTIDEDSPEAQRRMEQNQARGGKLPTGHKSQS